MTGKVKDAIPELHSFVQIPHENLAQLAQWTARLRALSASAIELIPFDAPESERARFATDFLDEYHNRSGTTPPFLAHLLGVRLVAPPLDDTDLDERLWWSLCSDSSCSLNALGPGPSLTAPCDNAAIEHWTHIQLCALHALWMIHQREPSADLLMRIRDAGVWIMHELQPDNAINRPWGIAVFVYLSLTLESESDRTVASMYAQTLAHNCSISLGKPDILSACILHDAAQSLSENPETHT